MLFVQPVTRSGLTTGCSGVGVLDVCRSLQANALSQPLMRLNAKRWCVSLGPLWLTRMLMRKPERPWSTQSTGRFAQTGICTKK
jgi:hypothetical protein